MKTYIYVLKLVSRLFDDNAWTKEDEELVTRHFNRLKKDNEIGKVILAGKTKEDSGFGIVIFKEESLEKARIYMEEDPAVKAGIMTAEVFEYKIAIM